MPRLDETRPFLPVNIALLTVSDTRDAAQDRSGNTLADLATTAGHRIAARRIVRDEKEEIIMQLKAWIADPAIDVVISTGGTGVTGRDVTPEAFHSVYEKEIAGFGELFRWRHLFVCAARLARRLPRRLGGHSRPPARQPLSPVQLRRADAEASGAFEGLSQKPRRGASRR
jgi:molybdenum cofactor synthesis domain-containing protein